MVVDLSRYPSHQIKLINEFDLAMVERNVNLLEKYLHKDYRHVILPKSLGKPAINRDEWLASMTQVFGTPIQFERPTYHSVVEAPGKVVLHASSTVKGLPGQDGTNESIWIVEFAVGADGQLKIKEIEQFADTNTYVDAFEVVKASEY